MWLCSPCTMACARSEKEDPYSFTLRRMRGNASRNCWSSVSSNPVCRPLKHGIRISAREFVMCNLLCLHPGRGLSAPTPINSNCRNYPGFNFLSWINYGRNHLAYSRFSKLEYSREQLPHLNEHIFLCQASIALVQEVT